MLHKLTQLSSMRVSTDESVAQLDLLMKAAGLNSEGAALLDSGASHPFWMPNQGGVQDAQTVKVQLADGKEVLLRQNRAGTLMPVASSSDENVAPIVPLQKKNLVQTLGCDVSWTRRGGLVVKHPVHGRMSTQVSGKCPIIGETLALELISEIETQKLKEPMRRGTCERFSRAPPSSGIGGISCPPMLRVDGVNMVWKP